MDILDQHRPSIPGTAQPSLINHLKIPKQKKFHELIIPTAETICASKLIEQLIQNNVHVLLIGPTGTAKTITVKDCLANKLNDKKTSHMIINFSGQTKAGNIQDEIEAKVCKRKRTKKGMLYLPDEGREHEIIFIDDMNMPQKEEYGA